MYPLGNYMNKKNVFFAFLWLFLCLHCMYLKKSPVDFLREVFAVCPVPIMRSKTWTKTVDVFIRSVTKPYALYTAICGITGSGIECPFQWCKRHGLLQTSLVANTTVNFKPQNALKRLKYPLSKWSWIRTLLNEVWGQWTDDRWVIHKPIKYRNKGAFFKLSSSKMASTTWSFCDSIAKFWYMIREYSLHLAPVYWIWW